MNKLVARFLDGRVMKGTSADFFPAKGSFHLALAEGVGSRPIEIGLAELKAVFFVRDFTGDPAHCDLHVFEDHQPPGGRRIRVVFKDGEVLLGITQGYQPGRPGFFVVPADPRSNIQRAFVVTAATVEVTLL